MVQRALQGIVDASSRLPHDIDAVEKKWRMLLHPGCTSLIDVFVVATNDVTTHAPKVIIFFNFVVILLSVRPAGISPQGGQGMSNSLKVLPSAHRNDRICFLVRPLGV